MEFHPESFGIGAVAALATVMAVFTFGCLATGRPTSRGQAKVEPGTAFDQHGKLTPSARCRLTQLRMSGFRCEEQLQTLAAEACEIFGVDPCGESLDRDWADEIVYHQADIDIAADRIWKFRRTQPVDRAERSIAS